jgi:transglutaminase-like putative cysteine protease
VLAVGRDYADVAPIDGVVLASGRQQSTTAVDVIPVEG